MFESRTEGLLELDLQYAYLHQRQTDLLRQLEHIHEEKRQLDVQRAAYAPVYSVPDDVLYQILDEAYAHDLHGCTLDYRCDTPITITHVSRRWRRIALSLPKIWACIHVPTPLSKAHIPLLNLHVTRSQPLPISFAIRCRFYKPSSPSMRIYMDCLAMLLKTRVRSCTLCTDYVDSMEALVGYLSVANKSCFEYLRLQVIGEEDRLIMNGECLSSSLRSLSLHSVRLPSPPIALQGLRRLMLEYQPISLRYLHEIAIACPELSTFTVREITTTASDSHLEARFPSLRRLSLLEIHFHGIRDLLCWIEAPRLDTLIIRDISLGIPDAQPIPAPQYKTYPALRNISIRFPSAAINTPEFLCHTPNVVSLDLTGTNATPLVRALLSADSFLPHLERLTATILWNERHKVVLDLVRHRERIRQRLAEIKLGHPLLAEMNDVFLQSLSKYVTVTRLD